MSNYNFITRDEIGKLKDAMGLNYKQFASACDVRHGSNTKAWITGKLKPTGPRLKRLLELKKQYLTPSGQPKRIKKIEPTFSAPIEMILQPKKEPIKNIRWALVGAHLDNINEALNTVEIETLKKFL